MEEYTITQFFNDFYTAQTLQEKQEIVTRGKELGIFNDESFVILKEDGSLTQSVDKTNAKIMSDDKQSEVTTEKNLIANRENKTLDDFVINNQKFNMQLAEVSDNSVLFENSNKAIGNFTLDGTVLVKAWDIVQKRYVLIRRRIRTPMLSTVLDAPQPQDALDLDIQAITSLDMGLAQKVKSDREAAALVIKNMQAAENGSIYHQDNEGHYTDTTATINVSGGTGTSLAVSTAGGSTTATADGSTASSSSPNTSTITGPGTIVGISDNTYSDIKKGDIIPSWGSTWHWPCPAATSITQSFCGAHDGLDISGGPSGTKICASRAGIVLNINYVNVPSGVGNGYGDYGACVYIDHGDGYGSLYAHLVDKSNDHLKAGDCVAQDEVLGYMGSTGRSTGTHLHFSIDVRNGKDSKAKRGTPVDPAKFVNASH